MASAAAIVGVIGTAIGGAGTLLQFKASKDAAKASEKAERLRERQANLEAARRRRQIAREAQQKRAQSLAVATNQGAQDSSSFVSGSQQITSDTALSQRDLNESQKLGSGIFTQNRRIAQAQGLSSFGSGLQSLGSGLVNNLGTIQRLSTFIAN